jgi:ATP-dependent helicase HrpB
VSPLPIEPILPAIADALAHHRSLVIQAPPGAGKTTTVPLALLAAPWLAGRSIVMLEPRRLATRAAAYRLADLHGDRVGETIGYRMRGDSRVGRTTRVEVVTEGILTRRLQHDPTLDGVGVVIFDEFHERSIDADLGLALALRTQALVRDDLRLAVMSATLDGAAVATLLGDAPVISSEGRAFPVETRYVSPRSNARIDASVLSAIESALNRDAGDILVFLPGAGEISRVAHTLGERVDSSVVIRTLYGSLSQDDQDRALRPDANGRRKIVLSTSIAETSLTIEGIRIVVDSGWSRRPRFSPATGMTRLETVRVSLASADQRRGRAGRLGPGVCYRCWPEHETHALLASAPPEIVSTDLAPLALSLAVAGVDDPGELAWLDPPAPAAFAQARELLRELDAIDSHGAITEQGRAIAELPLHPRLSHMLIAARGTATRRIAAGIAALLSERDVFRAPTGPIEADVVGRLDLILRGDESGALPPGAELDRDALRRARAEAERLLRASARGAERPDEDDDPSVGHLLALAYPDRVAQRRAGDPPRFVLRNGRGAELLGAQSLAASPYIVAAEIDDRRPNGRVFLAAPISLEEIRRAFADQIVVEDIVEVDDNDAVLALRRERLGAIVLREVPASNPDQSRIVDALLAAIRARGVARLPWSDSARRLRERLAFLYHHDRSWPDVSDAALTESLDEWLGPRLTGVRRIADIARADLSEALSDRLDWKMRQALDELAPTHIEVPTGSRIPVDYTNPEAPALAVRLQEVFGLTESPRVFGGRVPVTMQLLSPAQRPVQVTRDLAGFWRTSYFDVRKDLRGRYPKHEWPEDPLKATPTKRAKPRK